MLFLLFAISILSNRSGTTSRDRPKTSTAASEKKAAAAAKQQTGQNVKTTTVNGKTVTVIGGSPSDKLRATSTTMDKSSYSRISDQTTTNPGSVARPEVYATYQNGAYLVNLF